MKSSVSIRVVLTLLLFAVALGCDRSESSSGDRTSFAAVADDLRNWPDFIDRNRFTPMVEVTIEQSESSDPRIMVKPLPRTDRAELERLLGFALVNIARDRKLADLGFVSEGNGWRVLRNSSAMVEGEMERYRQSGVRTKQGQTK